MAFPKVEIKDYEERPNIFAIRLPSGRWHDFDRATLAAEWAWYYHLAKCDNHVTEALQVQIQNAVDLLNELDGVIPFTEALGKGDATEYDTELAYLVREVSRLAEEGATYLWAHTVNPLAASMVIGTENSVESTEDGVRWALVDAAYLARLRDTAAQPPQPQQVPVGLAGGAWVSVHEELPIEGDEPTYVLGWWADGDIRRCQIYKGELPCGFPARDDYPTHWMPEPPKATPLPQDGCCIACHYPRYVLANQHWGSCINAECVNHRVDMASASYTHE